MRELRFIGFMDQEVVAAVTDFRRRHHLALPVGTVRSIGTSMEHETLATTIKVVDDSGEISALLISSEEMAAALVSYCAGRKMPMPKKSDKKIEMIDGQITLLLTMSFDFGKSPDFRPPSEGLRAAYH